MTNSERVFAVLEAFGAPLRAHAVAPVLDHAAWRVLRDHQVLPECEDVPWAHLVEE
jgi:hypothetical protein